MVGTLQEILREGEVEIDAPVYDSIGRLGITGLLPICRPGVNSGESVEAIYAARAVVAVAKPGYRERWIAATR